jgi:hypothetical protein
MEERILRMADNTPAGWYPDPSGDASRQRYWDGTTWTEHYQNVTTTAGATPPGGYAPSAGFNEPTYYNAAPGYAQPLPATLPPGANVSLVLGIVSLAVFLIGFCIPVLPVPGVISIVTGIIGIYQGSRANKIRKTSQATAGFIMSIIALVLASIWLIIVIIFILILGISLGALSYSF